MKTTLSNAVSKYIACLAALLMLSSMSLAQDWAGRRYVSEDPSKCMDMMLKEAARDKEIQSMPAIERQAFMGVIALTEIKVAVVFKPKYKFAMTIITRLNEDAVKASKVEMDREKREQISTLMNQMSADMKETGTYSIKGDAVILTTKNGETTKLKIIQEDGKKLQAEADLENMILVRVK